MRTTSKPASPVRPVIGITLDIEEASQPSVVKLRYRQSSKYAEAVVRAGGVPMHLPPIELCIEGYMRACDGFILTGGNDIDPRPLGGELHPEAKLMHAHRQRFELALLEALKGSRQMPTLGICLGMQLMGVHAKGDAHGLVQHLPDVLLAGAKIHADDTAHGIAANENWRASALRGVDAKGAVASNHHQAISDPGHLAILAKSEDGVIEAVADNARPFYVGVQWHPERTADSALGDGIIEALVHAAANHRMIRSAQSLA
jgi:putative glutamine amidotransferase